MLQIVALSTRRLFLKPSLLTAPTLASEKDLIIIKAAEPAFLSPREDLRQAG